MEPIDTITSRRVVLPIDNVDTDQIIPARFLTVTTRDGLGDALFADWRRDPDFVLNQAESQGAKLLVVGDNFGCGSSREHAPWALTDFGFRAVISTSIADIFKSNATKNGLLPVEIDAASHRSLLEAGDEEITVDLRQQRVSLPGGGSARFTLDGFARHCLLQGIDTLDYLRRHDDAITRFESST